MKELRQDALVALDPLRAALRAAAQAEVDEVEARAAKEVDEVMATARREAEDIVSRAAAEGASAARASAALRSARVRREGHELVLAAQESLRAELVDRVVLAVQGLRGEPRYAAWVERLAQRCREALGPRATVAASPSGGVVGEFADRRLDLSIPILATAVVEAHAAEVRQLWTP